MFQIPNKRHSEETARRFCGLRIADRGTLNLKPRGFTLFEILVVVAIVGALGAIITASFSRYTRAQAVAGVATTITTALEDARSRTLSSKNASQYGVHLEGGSVILFRGDTYSAGSADNETTPVDPRVTITPSLNGGGTDIVFERLSGETLDYGTVAVSIAGDASSAETIIIDRTGLLSYND